jgi:SpoU rRNA methylase family enzyme
VKRRLSLVLGAVAGIAAIALATCSKATPETPSDRLLVVDGLEIRLQDVAPYVAFLDSFLPEGGRKVKIQRVLEEHVLPLFVARRAFGLERERMLRDAQGLVAVATNVSELDQQTAQAVHKKRRNQTRLQPRLPVAVFLFDPLLTGSVSQPIEVPQGWIVAGCYDIHQSPLATDDYVDGLQVGFMTHSDKEWVDWYEAEKKRLAAKATFVHEDYRDAMPDWIQKPKQP